MTSANRSDLLGHMQAIRYSPARHYRRTFALNNVRMETNAERRRRKLIELCNKHGGEKAVASAAKLNADALKQITRAYKSSHPRKSGMLPPAERGLGDNAARAIEAAFHLERGWLDNDGDTMMTPQELELVAIFRQLNPPTQAVVMEAMRQTRDDLQRQAERLTDRLRAPTTPKQ